MSRKGTLRSEEVKLRKKGGTFFIGASSAMAVKDEKGDQIENVFFPWRIHRAYLIAHTSSPYFE